MLKVKSVKDLGPQFTINHHGMVGQDGSYSIPLHDGRVLWFFGDTIIGRRIPGESLWYPGGKAVGPKDMSGVGGTEKMLNNTGLLSSSDPIKDGINSFSYITDHSGRLKQLIPLNKDEDPDRYRVWCMHGIEMDSTVYLFFIKVETIEEGIFPVNFTILGSGMAYGSMNDWNFKRVEFDGSDLLWKIDQPHFASAVLGPEGDYLYLYGVLQGKDKIQRCYLSRVKKQEILELDKYEYLSGIMPEWSKCIEDAIPVFDGMPNEQSVSYNKYLGRYLAVHSLDLSGKIVARTSLTPWGPWSEPCELFQVETDPSVQLPYPRLIYAGKEHPVIAKDDGKTIYVTYVEFEEYYPHLVEVNFE